MGVETNVVPDANQFNDSIDKFVRVLETIYSRDNDHSRKAALNRACVEMIAGKKNNAAVCKTIRSKFVEDVENQLIKSNTPFITIPTGTGDMMFIVPNKYEKDLIKAQENVMFTTTDYMMNCNTLDIAQSAQDMGYKNLIKLDFQDETVAQLTSQKLFQNNAPCSIVKNPDNTCSLYVHPRCMYKEDGQDMATLRLDMAFEASKGSELFGGENSSYLKTRLDQAKYDTLTLEQFASVAKSGKSMVLGDPYGRSNVFLETKNGEIFLNTKNKDNQWDTKKLDVSPNATKSAIKDLCSVHADKIYNMANIPTSTWNNLFKNTTPDKTNPRVREFQLKRPKINTKDANYHRIARSSLKEVMDAVIKEANIQTKAICKDVYTTNPNDMQKAYDTKVAAIGRLLDDPEFPAVKKFLNKNEPGLTKDQKLQWLQEMKSIFLEEKEIPTMAMEISDKKIDKAFKKEISQILGMENEKGAQKEAPELE